MNGNGADYPGRTKKLSSPVIPGMMAMGFRQTTHPLILNLLKDDRDTRLYSASNSSRAKP